MWWRCPGEKKSLNAINVITLDELFFNIVKNIRKKLWFSKVTS
jgi:hypothetical protein